MRTPTQPPIPADFRRALTQSGLLGFFRECVYVHRAGYLRWIATAGRPPTRERRIKQSVMRLLVQRGEVAAAALDQPAARPSPRRSAPLAVSTRRCA